MKKTPNDIELADVAKELGANIVIEFHTAQIKLDAEKLLSMKEFGLPTDPMSCFMAGFMMSGKTQEELEAFLNEANEAGSGFSVSFEAPEGGALNIKSKEENPLFDEIVQMVEKQK